jgi:hypothetical protein
MSMIFKGVKTIEKIDNIDSPLNLSNNEMLFMTQNITNSLSHYIIMFLKLIGNFFNRENRSIISVAGKLSNELINRFQPLIKVFHNLLLLRRFLIKLSIQA